MSEHHAQNVARGHKATLNNPDVSDEAKERSRAILEDIEGSGNPNDFTASVDSGKAQGYSAESATEAVTKHEKMKQGSDAPSRLFAEGEFDNY